MLPSQILCSLLAWRSHKIMFGSALMKSKHQELAVMAHLKTETNLMIWYRFHLFQFLKRVVLKICIIEVYLLKYYF